MDGILSSFDQKTMSDRAVEATGWSESEASQNEIIAVIALGATHTHTRRRRRRCHWSQSRSTHWLAGRAWSAARLSSVTHPRLPSDSIPQTQTLARAAGRRAQQTPGRHRLPQRHHRIHNGAYRRPGRSHGACVWSAWSAWARSRGAALPGSTRPRSGRFP